MSARPAYEAYEADGRYVIAHSATGTEIATTAERDEALLILRCLNEDLERLEKKADARKSI